MYVATSAHTTRDYSTELLLNVTTISPDVMLQSYPIRTNINLSGAPEAIGMTCRQHNTFPVLVGVTNVYSVRNGMYRLQKSLSLLETVLAKRTPDTIVSSADRHLKLTSSFTSLKWDICCQLQCQSGVLFYSRLLLLTENSHRESNPLA